MCCIFTCCGWMIDLVQRLWTFTMSCCISSAVCCSLVTASLSGVALGYNYSLAEYIDLKETNVSVYLKRGVFDDEIVDDMDWRRAGHLPVAGHIASANLRTGAPEHEESTVRSGRRLDDSVFGSEEQNKFEGSLMKLTAKPLDIIGTKPRVTSDLEMAEIIQKYPSGSIDQMKAIQSLINMRKSNVGLTTPKIVQKPATDERDMPPYGPGLLGPNHIEPGPGPSLMNPAIPGVGPVEGPNPFPGSGRRLMPYDRSVYRYLNPARLAVPDSNINQRAYWQYPKVPEKYFPFNAYDENANIIVGKQTYPPPITLNLGPVRPPVRSTSEVPPTRLANPAEEPARRNLPGNQANVRPEDEAQKFKESLLLNKFDMPSFQNEDVMKAQEGAQKSGDEDYEVEAEGAPVRRKRFTEVSKKPKNYDSFTIDLTQSRTKQEFREENSILYKLTTIYDKDRQQQIQNYFSNRNKRHTLMNMDGSVGEFITQVVKLPGVS